MDGLMDICWVVKSLVRNSIKNYTRWVLWADLNVQHVEIVLPLAFRILFLVHHITLINLIQFINCVDKNMQKHIIV